MSRITVPAAALALLLAATLPASAATISIINSDGVGEGLNDATVVAPVGGNAGATLGAQRLNVLQRAASIWGGILESNVTIRVQARFDTLACNGASADLGSGGPVYVATLTAPNTIPDTWYPAALANKLVGSDTNIFLDDIQLTLTSTFDSGCAFPRTWYYGLDGAGNPGTTFDAVTVALRELAHGLGFYTLVDVTTGTLGFGKNDVFMTFLEDHSTGLTWDEMSDGERATSAVDSGDLHWVGERVLDSIGLLSGGTSGGHVLMHAPAVAEPGATAIFWDASLTPNQLLEPSPTGANHDPGFSRAVMADIGWTLETCGNGVEEIGEICDSDQCCTATCGFANAGSVCDDGTFCNGTETCDAGGGCTGPSNGDPCPGPDGDANCSEQCDEGSDSCTAADPDEALCDDGDICSPNSECQAGACVGFGDNLCLIDPYLSYKGRAPRRDGLGQDLESVLPKPWVIKLNDFHLADTDADDPENFEVKKAQAVLNPALLGTAVVLEDAALNYLRYQMKAGREGIAAALPNGKFPKAAKHIAREWELTNGFGTIRVSSKKVTAFLLPAAADEDSPPTPPGSKTHFACYQVKVSSEITDQTPDAGNGKGKLRRDMQIFVEDEFDDCALDANGNPSFDGTPVEGRCLVDLARVKEFCSPVTKSVVDPPRESSADFAGTTGVQTDVGLLCYQGKPANKFTNAAAASLAGVAVGDKMQPRQSKHTKRRFRDGNPIFTAPGNGFDAPEVMETTKLDLVCLPTDVVSVTPVP